MNLRVQLAVLTMFVSTVCLATATETTDKKLAYDPARPLLVLHTAPERQHALTKLDSLLRAVTTANGQATPKPVVVYVHGRGNEPRKSFTDTKFTKGWLLSKVEAYDVGVIGFNWDSKIRPLHLCDRPVDKAVSAAPDFVRLVKDLQAHKGANPDFWKGRPLILLVHSMGSYVVRSAAESAELPTAGVFDRIVVTSSDAPADGHMKWLDKPVWGAERLVFVNPQDGILTKSMNCETKDLEKSIKAENKKRKKAKQEPLPITPAPPRLGLMKLPVGEVALSAAAMYVSVPAGERHRYFTLGGQGFNPDVCSLFRAALTGKEVGPQASWRLGDTKGQFAIAARTNKSDACFGKADEDSDDD